MKNNIDIYHFICISIWAVSVIALLILALFHAITPLYVFIALFKNAVFFLILATVLAFFDN